MHSDEDDAGLKIVAQDQHEASLPRPLASASPPRSNQPTNPSQACLAALGQLTAGAQREMRNLLFEQTSGP